MRRLPPPSALVPTLLALAALPAAAQETTVPTENVRTDNARVLRVDPVYQTLRATRMEQQCDEPAAAEHDKGLSRFVGAVKDVLKKDKPPEAGTQAGGNCRMVPVAREFRRAIAYDVEYMYKGAKYRSRLPTDPGNRLRVRVSVTPYVSGTDR